MKSEGAAAPNPEPALRSSATASGQVFDLGARIRELRTLRRCTLRVIAERSGLTESFLSQVERGRANASLASLQRITQALGVEIADVFDQRWQPQPNVLHREDRPAIEVGEHVKKTLLTPFPSRQFEVFCGEFAVGGSTGEEQLTHGDSEELFIVLSGKMVLHLAGDVFAMPAGSSISYRTSVPHRVVNVGETPAEAMWIISPPSRRDARTR